METTTGPYDYCRHCGSPRWSSTDLLCGCRGAQIARRASFASAQEAEWLRAEVELLRGHLASLIDVLTSPGHAVTPSEWEDATVLAGRFGATMPDWDNESGEGSEGGDA